MFEKVLIPTDFSNHARKITECLGDIPGVKEAILLNVITKPRIDSFFDPLAEIRVAEEVLAEEKGAMEAYGVKVRVKAEFMMEGEVAGVIQRVAEAERASLVVMGARGKSRIPSAFLGSASRNVLLFGTTHLLIMRYRMLEGERLEKYCSRIFAKVIFPTDLSQPAEAALSFLKDMGGIGELVLLHVVSRGETEEEVEGGEFAARERLEKTVRELAKGGLKASARVVVGDPVQQIRSVAEEEDVSLIAMSSMGGDALRTGSMIGSRTYDVANTAERPVLVIRMKPVYAVPAE